MNKCSRVKTGTYTKYGIYVSVVNYLAPCNINTFRKNIVFATLIMLVERVVDLFRVYTGLKITDIHFRMLAGTPVYEPQQHREF